MADSTRFLGARGEATLEFQGETLPILMTNRAIAEAEKATGKPVSQLALAAETGAVGINDIVQLLRAGLEYGRRDAGIRRKVYSTADAFDVMDVCGFKRCATTIFLALAEVIAYDGAEDDGDEDDGPPAEARSEKKSA